MKETRFCYSCRVHHEVGLMQLVPTRRGMRWRCRRSILAAMASQDVRDDFGRRQTEINREAARAESAFFSRPHRDLYA